MSKPVKEYVAPPPTPRCRVCGIMLADTLIEQGIEYHVMCDPVALSDERNKELKDQLVEMVLWVEEHAPRSQQIEIGPSEMGNPCDQRIGRLLAGMPTVNFRMDPWPAIVGTAVHSWLERAVDIYQKNYPQATVVRKWQTEVDLMVDDMIPAHSDLYTHEHDVVDYKTAGPSQFKKMKTEGPPDWYKVQVHLYAYAHERAGRPVRDVVLAFLPRAGWLHDTFLWREKYNRVVALDAIKRVYAIGKMLVTLEVDTKPHNWDQVPTTPGEHCYSCPFFVDRPAEMLPDATGCPGRSLSAEERKTASLEKFQRGLL